MSGETTPSVNAFFESYRAAFERFDAPAIVDHFAYPSHVTSDTGETVLMAVAGRQDWIVQIERLIGMYRAIAVSSARMLDVVVTELSPRLVQACVRWGLYDGAGNNLYEFDAIYTLAAINGALRITAISHNEIPRYQACRARLQSHRATGAG